jgi:hypothetical protein
MMRKVGEALGGRSFALAVFLAIYVGLLAIVFMPRDGLSASGHDHTSGLIDSAVIAAR